MRFLYIAPRYHTNQVPIMEGLLEHGHEVLFLSHYAGGTEDYQCVTPVIIGYSALSDSLWNTIARIKGWSPEQSGQKKAKGGFPPFFKLWRQIKNYRPDVAILRERSVYTIVATQICHFLKIPAILYNQSPLWEDEIKNDLPHRLVRRLTPARRITPVLGTPGEGKVKEPGASFVPFVMKPMLAPSQKNYYVDGILRIFAVGKYEERKNHRMLIEIITEMAADGNQPVRLTIAGACTTAAHQEFCDEMAALVHAGGRAGSITLLKNLTREQIFTEYRKADIFVIASTREPASISQLEAMAHSLPVICSDTNGTACYVEGGVNGQVFCDNDKESLREAILDFAGHPERLAAMGGEGYRTIVEKCGFEAYYQSLGWIMQKHKRDIH